MNGSLQESKAMLSLKPLDQVQCNNMDTVYNNTKPALAFGYKPRGGRGGGGAIEGQIARVQPYVHVHVYGDAW